MTPSGDFHLGSAQGLEKAWETQFVAPWLKIYNRECIIYTYIYNIIYIKYRYYIILYIVYTI